MPLYTPQPVWRYAIFSIPAILMVICLLLALFAGQLGWLPPRLVAVHLALDLSSSTYETTQFVPLLYGLSFIAFMWMMVLPLERFLDRILRIRVDYAGRIAIFNALSWTILTPILLAAFGWFNPVQAC